MSRTGRGTGGERQRATDHNTYGGTEETLSEAQLAALSALTSGATVTDAASDAGVDRTTVHRWLRDDALFKAAWNRVRRDREREALARIEQIAIGALDAVEQAVSAGETRVALAVLRGSGLLRGDRAPIGPEDPQTVARAAAADLADEQQDLNLRSLINGLFRR